MIRWLRLLLLAVLVSVTPGASAQAVEAVAPAVERVDEGRILVLLRLPPEHFRAGSSYGGSYGDGASRTARRRIATRLAQANGLTLVTDWPMPLVGVDCFVMAVPKGQSPEDAALRVSKDRAVAWSEPMHAYGAQATAAPNDPLYRLQPAAQAWRLADLHTLATGRNVRVAIVDSAVDVNHPDLAGQFVARQDFVTDRPIPAETHGTGVAGVIAAVADNNAGVVGVAPRARLMALRACWQQTDAATVCDTLSLAKALHFAIDNGARVINLSLSGPPDILLGRLLDAALARGVVVVGAADPAQPRGGFPASHPGVVAVASEAMVRNAAYVAPGRDVPTTQPGARYSLVNGSSYSAAHVSGLFALLEERGRVRDTRLAAGAGGTVDACATLMRGRAPCSACACAQAAGAPAAKPRS